MIYKGLPKASSVLAEESTQKKRWLWRFSIEGVSFVLFPEREQIGMQIGVITS